MPVEFHCSCGKRLKAADTSAGKKVKCPRCSKILDVPGGIVEAQEVETYGIQSDPVPQATAAPKKSRDREPCPKCGEMIAIGAAKCRFCGAILDPNLEHVERNLQDDDSTMTGNEWLVAVVCSAVGCVTGLVWAIQGKAVGLKMFGVSFGFSVLWTFALLLLAFLGCADSE